MNRSFLLRGVPPIFVALLAGSLVSLGLYRWEQTTRSAVQAEGSTPSPASPLIRVEEPTTTEEPAGDRPAPTAVVDPTAAGLKVFAQLCDACHPGGGAGLGPALSSPDFQAKYGDDATLAALIRQGTPGMPSFPGSRITDAELGDLIAFLRTLGTTAGQAGRAKPTPTEVSILGELTWTGSYARDIQPIFDEYCVHCHGATLAENGLRLDTYEGVMQGTRGGAVVQPGLASGSTLVWVIQGLAAAEIRMPHTERPLSPNRIQNIVLWIDAGAPED